MILHILVHKRQIVEYVKAGSILGGPTNKIVQNNNHQHKNPSKAVYEVSYLLAFVIRYFPRRGSDFLSK